MESTSSSHKIDFPKKVVRWACLVVVLAAMALGIGFGISAISRKRLISENSVFPKKGRSSENVGHLTTVFSPEESLLCKKATSAYRAENWPEAVTNYTKLCKKKPEIGEFAFRLAYSLHSDGRIDEAIEAHKRAAEFPEYRPKALYNLACAYSLKEDKTNAFKFLRKAISVGFISKRPIGEDSNFDFIKNDPEFQRLEQQSLPLEKRSIYRQFDFWIGNWKRYNKKGQLLGENVVKMRGSYSGLVASYSNHRGEPGSGDAYVDPEDFKWRLRWFGLDGSFLKYTGQLHDGKMQFSGKAFDKNGKSWLQKATFTPLKDGNIAHFIEISKDSGKTWSVSFDGIFRRIESESR